MTGEGRNRLAAWRELEGRVCVVTGAGGGIGSAIALALARAGARVALLDRDLASAGATRDAVAAEGGEALAVPCDVSEPDSVDAAAAACDAAFGGADVLVNNAGLLRSGPLETLPLAEWNALIAVNLTGYFLCAQAFARRMRARGGGAIVHVASVAARHPTPLGGAYSVAKAGVVMLSRQTAVEWAGDGIRSNVVSPGLILTPLSEAFYADADVARRRRAMIPAGRIGTPEDVADAVAFLASPRAAYITGDEITVDGGVTRTLMSLVPRPGYERAPHEAPSAEPREEARS